MIGKDFYVYVVEIKEGSKKLFINYTKNESVKSRFEKFKHDKFQLENPVLRKDLYFANPLKNQSEAEMECQRLMRALEKDGYETIAGAAVLSKNKWYINAIVDKYNPSEIYLGISRYSPSIRLKQINANFFRPRIMKDWAKVTLLNDETSNLFFVSKNEVKETASELKKRLKNKGLKVYTFYSYS